ALARHDDDPFPFERALTQLAFGERLRRERQPRRAQEALRQAFTVCEQLGALGWARHAAAELAACGGTRDVAPGPLSVLTPQELRVVYAVANGESDMEAAAALYISPRTVAFHLRNVFRKLDVRSRAALAALVHDVS